MPSDDRQKAEARAREWLLENSDVAGMTLSACEMSLTDLILAVQEEAHKTAYERIMAKVGEKYSEGYEAGRAERDAEVKRVLEEEVHDIRDRALALKRLGLG